MMASFRYQKKRMFFEHISVLIADSGSGICGLSPLFFAVAELRLSTATPATVDEGPVR